jgi:uncharacterized protein
MEINTTEPVKKKPILLFIIIAVILVGVFALVFHFMRSDEPVRTNGVAGFNPAEGIRGDAELSFTDVANTVLAKLRVEIAQEPEKRQQGLMGRTKIGEFEGMLFIFENDDERSFWMANTPLSLDIIFVNSNKEVVSIQKNAQPYSEESLPSSKPAMYVVEVNGGFCERHGISEGAIIRWNEVDLNHNSLPKEEKAVTIH